MARVFFVLSIVSATLGFWIGLQPVEATLGPSTIGIESWMRSAELQEPLRYHCGSALSPIDHTAAPVIAPPTVVTTDDLVAGCEVALRSRARGSVLFLATSSLCMTLAVLTVLLWMLVGTARLVARVGSGSPRTRHPAPHWS